MLYIINTCYTVRTKKKRKSMAILDAVVMFWLVFTMSKSCLRVMSGFGRRQGCVCVDSYSLQLHLPREAQQKS